MNNRALGLSLVIAFIAVFFVWSYVTSIEDEAKKKFGTEVLVITAKRDIKEMETINETMLEFKLTPKKFLEPAALSLEAKEGDKDSDKEKTRTLKSLAGMIALVPVKKGEQFTYNKLTEPSMRTGLATQIAPGKRAVAVPVNETSGVAKLLKPGDRVDLIAIVDPGGGKENKVAKTILQDVIVLSIGRYVTNNVARTVEADPFGGKDHVKSLAEDFSFTSVTLEVEPAQAQILALVAGSGDSPIILSLRNNDDLERVNLPVVGLAEIFGADAGRLRVGPQGKR